MTEGSNSQSVCTPWIGVVHLHLQSEHQSKSPRPIEVAFWARNRDECEELLAANAERLRIKPLWLENALPAEIYQRNGELTSVRLRLSRAVSPSCNILLDGDALQRAEEKMQDAQKNPWTDLVESCSGSLIAFATMENLEIATLLRSQDRGFKYMLGIVLGSMTPTVALAHLRDIPNLDKILCEGGPEFSPLLIHPPRSGPLNYELFFAPPLNDIVPFIDVQPPPEMLLDKIKEKSPEALEYLISPMPLIYSSRAIRQIARKLVPIPREQARERNFENMLTIRDEKGWPAFYEIPNQRLMTLGSEIDWCAEAEIFQDDQITILVKHALFDLTPASESPLDFVHHRMGGVLPVTELLKASANSVPYAFYVRYMLPVILQAHAEGLDLTKVPQIVRLFANKKITLPKKMEMFSNVLRRLRRMQGQESRGE